MTLAEVPMTDAESARALTDQIKVAVEGTWLLIKQAYETRAWQALGYRSWDDYCTREFGASRLKLPREERQDVVASLRESGLSLRAIAAATGLGEGTVQRDLKAGAPYGAPAPAPTFLDEEDDFDDYEEEEPLTRQPRTTGLDGKSYARQSPAPLRSRAPLPDFAFKTGVDLRRITERLERIAADDRLRDNRTHLNTSLRPHLLYAIEVCTDLLAKIQETPR